MHENILKWQLPVHAVIVAILLLLNQIWPYFQRTIIKISTSDLDNNLGRIKQVRFQERNRLLKENIPTCFTFPLLIQTYHNWISKCNLVVLSIVLPILQGSTETLSCSDFIFPIKFSRVRTQTKVWKSQIDYQKSLQL